MAMRDPFGPALRAAAAAAAASSNTMRQPTMTVLRVKRRREEEPLDTLVVNDRPAAQRVKVDHDPTDQLMFPSPINSKFFRLVDTVGGDAFTSANKSTSTSAASRTNVHANLRQRSFKTRGRESSQEQRREANAKHAQRERLKVISAARGIESTEWSGYRMYDVGSGNNDDDGAIGDDLLSFSGEQPGLKPEDAAVLCNMMPMLRQTLTATQAATDYVYDLYAQYTDPMELEAGTFVQIESNDGELVFDDDVDEETLRAEYDGEDSDSNDESNWRNDYPDEDEGSDGDEDDDDDDDGVAGGDDAESRALERHMRRFVLRDRLAPSNVRLTGDDEVDPLSSDDEEQLQDIIYGMGEPASSRFVVDSDGDDDDDRDMA